MDLNFVDLVNVSLKKCSKNDFRPKIRPLFILKLLISDSYLVSQTFAAMKKGFIYPHKLQEHLNTHTGDKPFKCKFCNAAFASSSNKRMHERAHLGIKVKQSKKQQQ